MGSNPASSDFKRIVMLFYIKVSAKNDQTLNKFSKFLMKLEFLPTIVKHFSKQKKKSFLTILKSPHVNKTAQEQFEFRFYTKEFLVNSIKPLTTFVVLKKIKDCSFPGIKFKVKSLFNVVNGKNRSFLKVLDPDNVILNKNSLLVSQKKCIQLFDCYGEVWLKELSYSKII